MRREVSVRRWDEAATMRRVHTVRQCEEAAPMRRLVCSLLCMVGYTVLVMLPAARLPAVCPSSWLHPRTSRTHCPAAEYTPRDQRDGNTLWSSSRLRTVGGWRRSSNDAQSGHRSSERRMKDAHA